MKRIIFLLMIIPLTGFCQEKFNGTDADSFKISREKIEKLLNQTEKTNLEIALRVIVGEAIDLKFEQPQKYDGKSFNTISLGMIDGLSYSSVVNLEDAKNNNPNFWKKVKYPVEYSNLADYDLELKIGVLSLYLDGKKIELPKINVEEIDAAIKNKKEEVEELKTQKGTLDELELTD